jgi:hypothetical protein
VIWRTFRALGSVLLSLACGALLIAAYVASMVLEKDYGIVQGPFTMWTFILIVLGAYVIVCVVVGLPAILGVLFYSAIKRMIRGQHHHE